jgi:hypothetical protein
MKPLHFNFYLLRRSTRPEKARSAKDKRFELESLDSIRARPRALFRMALQHLAFEVSRKFPELEGASLNVDIAFHGKSGRPKLPILTAVYMGRPIARQPVPLRTLDMDPFMSVLLKRHPHVDGEHVVFFLTPMEEGDAT